MRSLLMRRERKPAELLLVPMIDIFTVLVTFLLMTAVFSRIAIMQIDLPSSAAQVLCTVADAADFAGVALHTDDAGGVGLKGDPCVVF